MLNLNFITFWFSTRSILAKMTLVLQLLVAAVVVGLSAAQVPEYKEHAQSLALAAETVQENLLSMKGNIPLLNDYRRHYAEITYVINYNGMDQSGCALMPYYETYHLNLNNSAAEAISNPEEVLTKIGGLFHKIHSNINGLKKLIDTCVEDSEVCNELIDDTVKANEDEFGYAANVLIAAGNVAKEFNKYNGKFETVSKNLQAHQYVCTTPEDFEVIVKRLGRLYQVLNPLYRQC